MTKISSFIAFLAVLAALGIRDAQASPIALKITSGATTIIVSDNGVAISPVATKADQNPILGEVQWAGKIGDWVLNVDLGLGSDILGLEHMDLTYNATSTKATPSAPLTLWFSEVNVPRTTLFDATIGGLNNRTSTRYDTYYSASNGYFAAGTLIASSGVISSPLGSKPFHYNGSGTDNLTHLFSVTEKVTIAASGTLPSGKSRIAGGDAALDGTPVTEPPTLLMLGSGLAALAIVLRRRSKFFAA